MPVRSLAPLRTSIYVLRVKVSNNVSLSRQRSSLQRVLLASLGGHERLCRLGGRGREGRRGRGRETEGEEESERETQMENSCRLETLRHWARYVMLDNYWNGQVGAGRRHSAAAEEKGCLTQARVPGAGSRLQRESTATACRRGHGSTCNGSREKRESG